MNTAPHSSIPPSVAWLGYGGLLPFVGLALLVALEPEQAALWRMALVGYGAVILSFVGALHWAFAMVLPSLSAAQRDWRYVWSTVPALWAWPSTLLSMGWACAWLIVGFAVHYWQDRRLAGTASLPSWYLPLRWRLTSVACVSLAVAGGFSVWG